MGGMPGQRLRAVPHRGRPVRPGVPVLVPQPEVPVQARAGPAAALVRRFGARRRGRSARLGRFLAHRPGFPGEPRSSRRAGRAQGPQGGGPPRRAARDQGRVRPGRARPVAVRPGAAGPRRQPAKWLRPLGRHRRPDGRRAGPRPGRGVGPSPPSRTRAGWTSRLLEEYALLCTCSPSPTAGEDCRRRCGTPSGQDRLQPPPGRRAGRAGSRSGITGRCWPGATSSRTGSGPAGPGCGAARPAGTRCCSASRRRAGRSTTRWPSAPTPTRTWCSTRARSRCARPCWPGTTTPTTPWRRVRRAAGQPPDLLIAGLLDRVRGGAGRRSRNWTAGSPSWRSRSAPPAGRPRRGGDALPLHPGVGDCWPLFALSGGHPVTLAGEWTPRGLWPLTAWDEAGRAVPL